jgi:hypothetical protein
MRYVEKQLVFEFFFFFLNQILSRTVQIEKSQGFKCGTFGASALEDRHLATGNYGGDVQIW